MAEKIKKASPYFLILVLVGLVIAFNFWSALDKNLWNKQVEADTGTGTSSVSVGNTAPTINRVDFYGTGMSTIVLVENTSIDLMATITIEDDNGCNDVNDVEAWFLTTSDSAWWDHTNGGTTCSYDPTNCYDNTVVSCSYDSCAGNEVTFICFTSASALVDDPGGMKYYADPTSATASHSEDAWVVIVYASDSAGNDASSDSWTASDSAEVNLYQAIDIEQGASDSVVYGSVNPGGVSSIKSVGIRNTGNQGLDPIIEETGSMSVDGHGVEINSARQQYYHTTFTVTGTVAASLSADNETTALDLNLPQRGRGEDDDDPYASVSDDQLYWGIDIPSGQTQGDYKGSVSYTSTPD